MTNLELGQIKPEARVGNRPGLPPLLQPPRLVFEDDSGPYTFVPESNTYWRKMEGFNPRDQIHRLYAARFTPGIPWLVNTVYRNIFLVTGVEAVYEVGGVKRRLSYHNRWEDTDLNLPNLWRRGEQLLRNEGNVNPEDQQYEDIAQEALLAIRTNALNHDVYGSFSQEAVPEIGYATAGSIAGILTAIDNSCSMNREGNTFTYTIEDKTGNFYAPWKTLAYVYDIGDDIEDDPREMLVSNIPQLPIYGYRLVVKLGSPVGNPDLNNLLQIQGAAIDSRGNALDHNFAMYVCPTATKTNGLWGIDHRSGMVNFRQQNGARIKNWYQSPTLELPDESPDFDGVETKERFTPDLAYTTLLRMISELVYYTRHSSGYPDLRLVDRLLEKTRPSFEFLENIVAESKIQVSRHKIVEGMQQIIALHNYYPCTWIYIARQLGLEKSLFPRSEPLFEKITQADDLSLIRFPETDDHLASDIEVPSFNKDFTPRHEITGIERILVFASEYCGIEFPQGLSALGKLSWLYELV